MRNKSIIPGAKDISYYFGRQFKRQLAYRLKRRTDEVDIALRKFNDGRLRIVVDVGTADALMLYELHRRLGSLLFLGFDLSFDLLRATSNEDVFKVQGDALHMPMKSGTADAVIAAAVIEHLVDATSMLEECARILRIGGLLVLTTPVPFMERVSAAIGLLKETGHQHTFELSELCQLSRENHFGVLAAYKFMFSPIGFPFEKTIEAAHEKRPI